MIDWVIKFAGDTVTFNSIFGISLYWVPMCVCVIGYTLRTSRNIQLDKKERSECEDIDNNSNWGGYTPTDTYGDLIGRAVVSFVPICNLWAATFDVSPTLFGNFFKYLDKAFNQPIVPKRK